MTLTKKSKAEIGEIIIISICVLIYIVFVVYLFSAYFFLQTNEMYSEKRARREIWEATSKTPRKPLLVVHDWKTIADRWSLKSGSKKTRNKEWQEIWTVDSVENFLKYKTATKKDALPLSCDKFTNEYSPSSWKHYSHYNSFLVSLASVPNIYLWKDFLFYCERQQDILLLFGHLQQRRDEYNVEIMNRPNLDSVNQRFLQNIVDTTNHFFAYVIYLARHPKSPIKQKITMEIADRAHTILPWNLRDNSWKNLFYLQRSLAQLATQGCLYLPIPLTQLIGEYLIHSGEPQLLREFAASTAADPPVSINE